MTSAMFPSSSIVMSHAMRATPVKGNDDKKERKRMQNRIAQRTYRKNQKQRLMALESAVSRQSCDTEPFLSSPPFETFVDCLTSISKTPGIAEPSNFESSRSPWCMEFETAWGSGSDTSPFHFPSPPTPTPTGTGTGTMGATDAPTGRAALHLAAGDGNESMTRLLLLSGADVEKQDSSGCTPLHLASAAGKDAVVKLLLDEAADPNGVDALGRTALFLAVKAGHETTTRLLLEETEVQVNAKDATGKVALHAAVEGGSESLVSLLLAHGANVNA